MEVRTLISVLFLVSVCVSYNIKINPVVKTSVNNLKNTGEHNSIQLASNRTRKLHYPTPHFDNLRLFSTPLNAKMFLAGVFRSPINHTPGANFSKVGVNVFI